MQIRRFATLTYIITISTIILFSIVNSLADECVSVAPSANCTPGFSVPPSDELTPTCSAIASAPVGTITKTSNWSVSWPDGVPTTFRATAGGECLYTQFGCCLGSTFEFCWPLFNCPTVAPGNIRQVLTPRV